MCAPSPPAAPDYKGAAETEAASQRVNQITPWGSLEWSQVGGTPATAGTPGSLQVNKNVSPWIGSGTESDPLLPNPEYSTYTPATAGTPATGGQWQTEMKFNPELTETFNALFPRIAETYSQPMDLSSMQKLADEAYGAQTSRLDPEWQQREQSMQQNLANQGIGLGSEAYSNAMRDFGQQRNDAYQQARLGAIATMPQTYELAERQYAQPLNTLNALRTGQMVNPQVGGTDYLRALQGQAGWNQGLYNAEMGAYNNQLSGAATIAAAMISDRRLKRDIEPLDSTYFGYPLYRYSYVWEPEGTEPHVGVMADEVMEHQPEAVIEVDGYLAVNYGMLQ